jgi:hypothetical protein
VSEVLNKNKHLLESLEEATPDLNLSKDWLELAELYEQDGSRANTAYCKTRAKRWAQEATESAPDFDWQNRADIE